MAADGGDGSQNDNADDGVDGSDSQRRKCVHTPELHCEKICIRMAVKVGSKPTKKYTKLKVSNRYRRKESNRYKSI